MININKYFIIILILLLNTLSFSTSKNTIYCGSVQGPITLDPAQAWEDISTFYTFNIFDTLVKLNPATLAIEPSLAISWETKNKGVFWIFKLRKEVKFHDGSDFDSSAVVFSFKRQMDKNFKYRYYNFPTFDEIFGNIQEVKALDRYTVAFHLKEPFYPFLATLTSSGASIVSPNAVKKYKKMFPENPVGTGPYMLKIMEKGKRLVLTGNPKYWRGKPDVDEFIILIHQKHDFLHNQFRNRKTDILLSYSISRTLGLKKLSWTTIKRMPTMSTSFIAFNFNNLFLKRKNIRKAIRCLWDKRILKYIYQDYVSPSDSLLPPGLIGYDKTLKTKIFSIEKARELLKKENVPNKIVFDFPLIKGRGLDLQMIKLFSKNLKKVGIEIKITYISEAEYNKKIAKGNYDLTFNGWIADYPDPHSIISSMFNSQLQTEGFPNISSYGKKEVLTEIIQAAKEENSKKREEMYTKINRMINEEVLCIPLFQDNVIILYNNIRIAKLQLSPLGKTSLFNIKIR